MFDAAYRYILVAEGKTDLKFDSYNATVEAFVSAHTGTTSVFGQSNQTLAIAQQSGSTGYLRKPVLSSFNADGTYILLVQVRRLPQA